MTREQDLQAVIAEIARLRAALERAERACTECDGGWWIRGEGEEDDTTCGDPLHIAIHAALASQEASDDPRG
jgi:hypothetical protein